MFDKLNFIEKNRLIMHDIFRIPRKSNAFTFQENPTKIQNKGFQWGFQTLFEEFHRIRNIILILKIMLANLQMF
jgi:hypothetical protein